MAGTEAAAAVPAAIARPSADDVLSARLAAGLTQAQAAELVHLGSYVRWLEYERGTRAIDVARWELFMLLSGQHPRFDVVERPSQRTERPRKSAW